MANPYEQMFSVDLFDGKEDVTNYIDEAFNHMNLNNELNDEKIKDLEEYLTAIFYNGNYKGKSMSSIYNKLVELTKKYLSEKFGKVIEDFDFDKYMATVATSENIENKYDEQLKIQLDQIEAFQHSNGIYLSTIEKRIEQIKQKLNAINNLGRVDEVKEEAVAIYQAMIQEYNNLKQIASNEGLIKEYKNGAFISAGDKNNKREDILSQINKLDEMYQELSFYRTFSLSSNYIGKIFEICLQYIGDYGEDITQELVSDMFQTIGDMSVSRIGSNYNKSRNNNLNVDIKISSNEYTTKKKEKKIKNNYILKNNSGEINITKSLSNKESKTDISFTLPGLHSPLNVSAKNWLNTNDVIYDFGDTTIFDAFIRNSTENGDYDLVFYYGLQLGWAKEKKMEKNNYIKALHHLAILQLVLDTVIGYSQGKYQANTLIINNRDKRQIRVYNIRAILNKIKSNFKSWDSISNYNDNEIENAILDSGLNFSDELSNQNYMSLLQTALSKKKYYINKSILE